MLSANPFLAPATMRVLSALQRSRNAASKPADSQPDRRFGLGNRVRKIKGSSWQGRVVGFYSTALTPIGYVVESEREPGSAQIYPESALEPVVEEPAHV